MLNIFKYINYAFKTKKSINQTDEFIKDVSFGHIEGFFILSFIILGLLGLGFGFLAFYYDSGLALFFAIMFLSTLSFDIWVFMRVKKFFTKMSKNMFDFTKQKYKKINSDRIIDIDYE